MPATICFSLVQMNLRLLRFWLLMMVSVTLQDLGLVVVQGGVGAPHRVVTVVLGAIELILQVRSLAYLPL